MPFQCYSLDLLPAATNLDADTEETLGGLSWGYSSYDYFNDSYAGSVSISHHLAIFSHTNLKSLCLKKHIGIQALFLQISGTREL